MDLLKKGSNRIDPLTVTESLGFQTFRRASRKPWSKEEDMQLIQAINEHSSVESRTIDPDSIKWDVISQKIFPNGTRKAKDCRKRWCNSLDPTLKKGKWTKEEDERLIEKYNKYGASWQKVASEIPGRTDDQCAKRYIEVLDPSMKDRLKPWSHDEDLQLVRQVGIHGTKWRTIALEIKGRPSLTCRNRWRKLVTDVVRGKADPVLRREVNFVRSGQMSSLGAQKLELDDELNVIDKVVGSLELNRPISMAFNGSVSSVRSPETDSNSATAMNPSSSSGNKGNSAPCGIHRPNQSNVEWQYQLSKSSDDLSHGASFDEKNGGYIKDKALAQYLIAHAKQNGLEITVHQHIHHHYFPQGSQGQNMSQQRSSKTLPFPYSPTSFNSESRIQAPFDTGVSDNNYLTSGSNLMKESFYYAKPDAELSRYQHFNYLPPLTEVPKLNSSSPSSSNFLKPEEQKEGQTDQEKVNDYRDSELNRFLNSSNHSIPSKEKPMSHLMTRDNSSSPNSLTPLTQAVEAVAAAEASGLSMPYNFLKLDEPGANPLKKRKMFDPDEEETEEGMDFWETMRHLTDISNYSQSNNQSQQRTVRSSSSTQTQKPVSKHHPLHNFSNSNTPAPAPQVFQDTLNTNPSSANMNDKGDVEEEEEEEEEELGLFYNVYTKEPSAAPVRRKENINSGVGSSYEGLVSVFDMIPFNPS